MIKKIVTSLLLIMLFAVTGCDNEPVGTFEVDEEALIEVDSELYNLIETIIEEEPENIGACIDFIYAFTIIVYDSELEIVDSQIMESDQEFSEFLASIPLEHTISVSYPIMSVLSDGTNLEINNNEELKNNIDRCIEEEAIGYCNALLEECVWKVTFLDGENNDFEDAYFDVSNIGKAWFHTEEEIVIGTWISYFVENQLHLNINVEDDEIIGETWNKDWNITINNSDEMLLSNNGDSFLLRKECFNPCKQVIFEECEDAEGSGTAVFNLESYIECFVSFSEIEEEELENVNISFHETFDDALDGINPILETTNYTNIANPQLIYVRFEDDITAEYITHITIFLVANTCD